MSERDRGVLFPNKRKKEEGHPDLTGTINVGGEDLQISAWLRDGKDGDEYLSLSVRPRK